MIEGNGLQPAEERGQVHLPNLRDFLTRPIKLTLKAFQQGL